MWECKGSVWLDVSKQALLSCQGLPGFPLELGAAILVPKLTITASDEDPYPCLGRASRGSPPPLPNSHPTSASTDPKDGPTG